MQMEERRRFHRAQVRKQAKVVFGPNDGLIDCVVLNLSIGGACLELASPAIIPDQFDLTFDAARTLRACRVAWRSGYKIGVAFV
jgi:hypothetical protein